MKNKILFILCLLLAACGTSNGVLPDTQTCTIFEYVMMCPDGTEYELPEPVDEPVDVVTEPTTEEDPDALCEKDNRNNRKCRRIKT